ncbi:MAG: hypothetical protein HY692_08120 [Cyanobacteria bacterium NC_groundwater_1444_Ag_S-0.65um_54_12]|nr:hypothetical protein [Cyanobacteria bacterium NC_groundwater_1444_Ag_S-0.65um_54_12]
MTVGNSTEKGKLTTGSLARNTHTADLPRITIADRRLRVEYFGKLKTGTEKAAEAVARDDGLEHVFLQTAAGTWVASGAKLGVRGIRPGSKAIVNGETAVVTLVLPEPAALPRSDMLIKSKAMPGARESGMGAAGPAVLPGRISAGLSATVDSIGGYRPGDPIGNGGTVIGPTTETRAKAGYKVVTVDENYNGRAAVDGRLLVKLPTDMPIAWSKKDTNSAGLKGAIAGGALGLEISCVLGFFTGPISFMLADFVAYRRSNIPVGRVVFLATALAGLVLGAKLGAETKIKDGKEQAKQRASWDAVPGLVLQKKSLKAPESRFQQR